MQTIGNPLSWTMKRLSDAARYTIAVITRTAAGTAEESPVVATLGTDDVWNAIAKGWDDFLAFRSDVIFIVFMYPLIGIFLFAMAAQKDTIQLLFPMIAGFALVGPVAAVGLYEMSRRREAGESVNWLDALDVVRSPAFAEILILGVFHLAIFIAWIMAADAIHAATLGRDAPGTPIAFATEVLTTSAGWAMIVIGIGVGFLFAAFVLICSAVSFPLILDRRIGVVMAIATSIRVSRKNPRAIALWGFIVAAGLVLGSLPALLGLIVVLPVLGHATWHLYRKAVPRE